MAEDGTQQQIIRSDEFVTEDGTKGIVYAKNFFDENGEYLGTEEFVDFQNKTLSDEEGVVFYTKDSILNDEDGIDVLEVDTTMDRNQLAGFLKKALIQNHCNALGRMRYFINNNIEEDSISLGKFNIDGKIQYIYIENIVDNGDGTYTFDVISSANDKRTDVKSLGTATIRVEDEYGRMETAQYKDIFENIEKLNGNDYYTGISVRYDETIEQDSAYQLVFKDGKFVYTYNGEEVAFSYGSYHDIKNSEVKTFNEYEFGIISPAIMFVPETVYIADLDATVLSKDLYDYAQGKTNQLLDTTGKVVSGLNLYKMAKGFSETGLCFEKGIWFTDSNVKFSFENTDEKGKENEGMATVTHKQNNLSDGKNYRATRSQEQGELPVYTVEQVPGESSPISVFEGMTYTELLDTSKSGFNYDTNNLESLFGNIQDYCDYSLQDLTWTRTDVVSPDGTVIQTSWAAYSEEHGSTPVVKITPDGYVDFSIDYEYAGKDPQFKGEVLDCGIRYNLLNADMNQDPINLVSIAGIGTVVLDLYKGTAFIENRNEDG